MGIYATDLRELIVRPTLQQLGEWTPTAENLLMGTAAQESQLGFRMRSYEADGYGLFRISAATHLQIWDTFVVKDPDLASRLRGLASQQQFLKTPHHELTTNLSYATGVAWMIYRQHPLSLPENLSSHELAECWFYHYYNRETPNQKPNYNQLEIDKFLGNYRKLVLRENKKLAA